MSKFYTASTQAKELCDEAKVAKEKDKELANEVLLKKGEAIRQSKEVTRLLAVEMKLKNEVKELKTNYKGVSHKSPWGESPRAYLISEEG